MTLFPFVRSIWVTEKIAVGTSTATFTSSIHSLCMIVPKERQILILMLVIKKSFRGQRHRGWDTISPAVYHKSSWQTGHNTHSHKPRGLALFLSVSPSFPPSSPTLAQSAFTRAWIKSSLGFVKLDHVSTEESKGRSHGVAKRPEPSWQWSYQPQENNYLVIWQTREYNCYLLISYNKRPQKREWEIQKLASWQKSGRVGSNV